LIVLAATDFAKISREPRTLSREKAMEIVGIGTDIVECLRIGRMVERHGELFLTRIFTGHEIQSCQARKRAMEHFAAGWAAKEAILKALGITWKRTLSWHDMEVRRENDGKQEVRLSGTVRELAEARHVGKILLSTSHCRAYAVAYAVALLS
jgi:holo-[acyl-carrier protein] synthase